MYEVEKSSSIQIKEQLNLLLPNGHMPAFLKQLDITRRPLAESVSNAIQTGRLQLVNNNNKRYKSGMHIDWTDKLHYYRSSYELEFYKLLDRKQKIYKTETLRVSYYDSVLKKHRIAIPDIIIGKLLIEIKSNFTFNQTNMLDKFDAYRSAGFRPILILDGKVKFLKRDSQSSNS
jgi:hypothetical protein